MTRVLSVLPVYGGMAGSAVVAAAAMMDIATVGAVRWLAMLGCFFQVAFMAKDLAFGEFAFSSLFCPRPDSVGDLLLRVYVIKLQIFPASTGAAGAILREP